jgi:hypothetical protein
VSDLLAFMQIPGWASDLIRSGRRQPRRPPDRLRRPALPAGRDRLPVGDGRFPARPIVSRQDAGDEGLALVEVGSHVPPTMEWLVESLLVQTSPHASAMRWRRRQSSTPSTTRPCAATSVLSSSAGDDTSRRVRLRCLLARRGGRAVECGGLENRYGSLGSSRVQIPPSPLEAPRSPINAGVLGCPEKAQLAHKVSPKSFRPSAECAARTGAGRVLVGRRGLR